ncbi:hypothetical protein SPSIL_037020 [Sporomusa silvacetica DSM 10669]|uniref:Dinitrogenase iron-molybdenum cofactor biosynthesis domain-containing protein n=1 Tax=Sporomusa silvacetica DSM 10669 TaxID=1123289 RepID=A0ABZ3IQ22_9FIRM|nr:NifB/NifX family molybdenum-iron cluster-binding protein [Sporomusa silvacetica]OZC19885.1 dinitrogenase iron-molybdenum cofactor [Sporomusa silvacetica DSM 10669]
MNIAVVAEGHTLDSKVAEQFDTGKYLLIVNMSDMHVSVMQNQGDALGEKYAKEVIKHECEGVITGKLKPEVFDLLAEAYVTRYLGVGYSVKEALDLMGKYSLKLIRNYEGTDECIEAYHECDGTHHQN